MIALTWGTLLLELLLAEAWISNVRAKVILLFVGIAFHVGIAVFMGLISFSMAMAGALVMYLGSATIYFGGVEVGRRRYRSHVPD
ncbi:hypothetical protein [Corynebacterium sp. LaCa142]|uniref:hypothetical protein n=1 Tax=Corynebacterium sp. LaCa142 TaxID=3391425 RepID=UPI00398A3CAF